MFSTSAVSATRVRWAILIVVLAVFGLALVWTYIGDANQGPSYPYSTLLADARAGKVESVTQDGLELRVRLTDASDVRNAFVASGSVNVYDDVCTAMGKEAGPDCPIRFEVVGESQAGQWVGLLITAFLPVLLIGGFIFFMMRSAQRQARP